MRLIIKTHKEKVALGALAGLVGGILFYHFLYPLFFTNSPVTTVVVEVKTIIQTVGLWLGIVIANSFLKKTK